MIYIREQINKMWPMGVNKFLLHGQKLYYFLLYDMVLYIYNLKQVFHEKVCLSYHPLK